MQAGIRCPVCTCTRQCHLRQPGKAVALKIQALQASQAGQAVRKIHYAIVAKVKNLQGSEGIDAS